MPYMTVILPDGPMFAILVPLVSILSSEATKKFHISLIQRYCEAAGH